MNISWVKIHYLKELPVENYTSLKGLILFPRKKIYGKKKKSLRSTGSKTLKILFILFLFFILLFFVSTGILNSGPYAY
jgi:hypothetical protein